MKLFYWSPFLSNIATVDAVTNSINSLKRYGNKNKYKPFIVDSSGEWQEKLDKTSGIDIIKLYNKNYYKFLPRGNFLKSRLSQMIIFILNFNVLRNLLLKEKPDFLVAHLVVSLPLVLFFFFKFETKLIIRISGTPKLNKVRRFFWALFSKNVHIVTCPTQSTLQKLTKLKIFPKEKIKLLYDPILNVNSINIKKREKLEDRFLNINYILSIGRLTKQKNFFLLISAFKEITQKYPNLKLIILGEGDERKKLEKLIEDLSLSGSVFLEGYKKNIFNYLNNCECYISSSLYEDPGFSLIESGFLNKAVIAADSNTGPSEILNNSKNGFLFRNNDKTSLVDQYFKLKDSNTKDVINKKINLKKFSKNFSVFRHFKNFEKILSN
jgi:glycosyltransferase involved in cell wall biosynthesis